MKVVRTAISGSYHRAPGELKKLYDELALARCQILSPFTTDFENPRVDFVINTKETILQPDELERRHLTAIAHADVLFLHLPDGYVGLSTALEIGFAMAKNIPICAKQPPAEAVFRPLVKIYPSVFAALHELALL